MNYYNFGKNYYNPDLESNYILNLEELLNKEKNMIDFLRGYMVANWLLF